MNRRTFIQNTALLSGSISIKSVYSKTQTQPAPSDRLNLAFIGAGGRGYNNLQQIVTHNEDVNIVALCDVHMDRASKSIELFPNARQYQDFRIMLEKEKDIDAVVVSTPDHTHAIAAKAAMELGKHVYCEKPLAHTLYEVRQLTDIARKSKVVTQMGHQGHASEQSRLCCEWIWDGAIGPVREVHIWSNRPTGSNYLFPCGTERPEEQQPIPEGMNWDLWIGPAPYRPYHRNYAPTGWRAYYDFGAGPLGDMGCHQIDPIYWALKLNKADTFEVQASKTYHTQKAATETYPVASIVRYSFPARDDMPPVEITWYDGGMMPPIPEEMAPDRTLPVNGAFVIGDKGILMNAGTVGAGGLRLIPEEKMQAYNRPAPTLKRSPGHHKEWVQACKTGEQSGAHFGYSGPLAEIVLVGCLAIRMADPLPVKLKWDKKQMRVTNVSQVNEFLHYPYREGWFL